MDKRELHERIDSCRPGSNDLHSPENADLARIVEQDADLLAQYGRVQSLDAQIAEKFADQTDVAVPDHLEEHLLQMLAGPQGALDAVAEEVDSLVQDEMDSQPSEDAMDQSVALAASQLPASQASSAQDSVSGGTATGQPSRRKWLWVGGAVSAAAMLAVFLASLFQGGNTDVELDVVLDFANRSLQEADQKGQWKKGPLGSNTYPFSSSVRVQPKAWQQFSLQGELVDQCMVFDATNLGQQRVLLLACRLNQQVLGVADAPPAQPHRETGGWCVSAWQSDGLTYVLAVEGDARRYGKLIRASEPLAGSPGDLSGRS